MGVGGSPIHPHFTKRNNNMAATSGSVYQAARVQHIAGNPPNTDPQRVTETFEGYVARMAVAYLQPDIDATESDAVYLARLKTYVPAGPTASYALNAVSASYAVSASATGA